MNSGKGTNLYLATMHPAPTAILAEHFAVRATAVRPLAGEVDLNYRVTTAVGKDYVLKITRPGTDPASLEFERAVARHLDVRAPTGLRLPHPVGEVITLADGRLARLQTWVEGRPLSTVRPITYELRERWGTLLGQLTRALADFDHPAAPTDYKWNPSQTLECRPLSHHLSGEQRQLANLFWQRFEKETLPALPDLPLSITYNDGHGDNLLVGPDGTLDGVIDFGDAMRTHTICELAIGCAYAGMGTADPLEAMADLVRGYVRHAAPVAAEHLLNFITARLLITVCQAAANAVDHPDNEYLQVSAVPAWRLLDQLRTVDPGYATARFRAAQGQVPHPAAPAFREWSATTALHPVVDLCGKAVVPFDLSVGSHRLGLNRNFEDLPRFCRHVERWLEDETAHYGIGGYGETRPVYTTDDFATEGNEGPRWRSVHLGVDVWGPAGTTVHAPYPGFIHNLGIDPTDGGYGAVILVKHRPPDGPTFHTLYGHLSAASLEGKEVGDDVTIGETLGWFGTPEENGGWPPHLHLQCLLDPLGYGTDFPGVAYPDTAATWLGLCPNPYPLLGMDAGFQQRSTLDGAAILKKRQTTLGRSLSLSYRSPLHILRGSYQYLYDHTGRRYLDTVNNVAHVGHEHPAVVEALTRQAAVLNTNTRYLHPEIVRFAEEVTAILPPALSVVHFVNSGSEANELALRMCEAWSGTRRMLAVEVGYHGNTGRTIDVSGYKFDGKGGGGCPPDTTVVPLPDVFRGRHRGAATAGRDYAAYAISALKTAAREGLPYGGFIAESILSCGGQIVLPEGYLQEVYAAVRAHGGLCVADEVQVGLGRVGSHWWGFELQGVVPDIVTIGKPLGNGHPLGAVVCTPAVADAFANGMEYFNTFGGNPVSCAVGRAVLGVLHGEGLRREAAITGGFLKTLLNELAGDHPLIGDIRGEGLFLGVELVGPDLAPATAAAAYVVNRMRTLGFLMSTDGPAENVLKIKPPLWFDQGNAEQLTDYLGRVLAEDGAQPPGLSHN